MKKNLKKIMSVLLAMIMIVSVVPMSGVISADLFATKASAEELASTGQCGEKVYWTFDSRTGLLTISGEGDMYDYSSGNSPFRLKIQSGSTSIKTIVIENGITKVGNYAFEYQGFLTNIVISDTVKSIGDYAFYYCSSIKTITIPDSVESIGEKAFSSCRSVQEVNLGDGIKSCGYYAFYCESIVKVNIKSLESWCNIDFDGSYANPCKGNDAVLYLNGEKLTSLVIPDNVTSIGSYTFSGLKELISVVISESVTNIDSSAFSGCTGLTTVTIPDSVTYIGPSAFYNCENLKEVNITDLKSWCEISFGVGPQNTSGQPNANPFESSDADLYVNGEKITDLVIPETVTKINHRAFNGCSHLTSVTIPASVTSIGKNVFDACTGLESIVVDAKNTKYNSRDNSNAIISYGTLIAGCGSTVIPKSVTVIGDSAFRQLTNLVEITIPDSVKTINDNAFYGCSNLKEIVIPDSVERIGYSSFSYCSGLKSVKIGKGVSDIGYNAFDNKTSIEKYEIDENNTVYDSRNNCNAIIKTATNELIRGCKNSFIPYGVEKIYSSAFENCIDLTEISIPDSVTSIGGSVFEGCTDLKNVTLSNSITEISYEMFYDCKNLVSIIIPDGVKSIGYQAFRECSSLKSITIPDSLETIGDYAFYFYGTCSLEDVFYTGTKEQWESISGRNKYLNDNVHYNYGKISGQCGDNVSWNYDKDDKALLITGNGAIDSNADFNDYGWYSFKDEIEYIKVADGVTSVGANAFSGCGNLKEAYLGDLVNAIGENAFADCKELSIVAVTSKLFSADNAFSGNNAKLRFVIADGNNDAVKFASDSKIAMNTFAVNDKTIEFSGNTVVYGGLNYNYINEIVKKYSSAEKIHFVSLEFDGIKAEKNVLSEFDSADKTAQNLTLNDLYIKIQLEKDGKTEFVSFAKMFELLENGDYDTFKLFMESEEQTIIEVIFRKIAEFFDDIGTNALRVIRRAINFVSGIFRR